MNLPLEQETILPQIHQMGSWIPAQRKHGEQQLRQMGSDAIAPLLAVLEQERSHRAQRMRLAGWITCAFVLAILGICVTWVIAVLLRWHWGNAPLHIMQPLYIAVAGLTAILVKPTRMQKRAARALAQCDSLEAVGPLIEALGYKDKRIRPDIVKALTRLLPRVKASDDRLLDGVHKSILNQALSNGDTYQEADFLVAIIQALTQVGGSESIPFVQRWTGSWMHSPGGLRVQETARACLPVLQARAEKKRVSGTLLRPSEKPKTGPDALLRPAANTPNTAPEQLLRASLPELE